MLAGPAGSGEPTWTAAHFAADAVVSSDRLRAVVGAGENDIAAVGERYALLEDALAALPVLWGPGAKPFRGQVLDGPARHRGLPAAAAGTGC